VANSTLHAVFCIRRLAVAQDMGDMSYGVHVRSSPVCKAKWIPTIVIHAPSHKKNPLRRIG
jgi:hypothetical protein